MAAMPEPQHSTVQAIYRAYEAASADEHRPHLGASQVGHPCERRLWLTFRWAKLERFDGRMLRLFETGNLAEQRFVANLRAIGAQVHDLSPSGDQWRVVAVGGHFGGSLDAAILGLPEAPKAWHVSEFKTHSAKSFAALCVDGLRKSKPQHYAQMQIYMGLTGMERGLYLAVNKNTDELYAERVEFDPAEFARLQARATRVITAAEPPLRISNDPAWYVCRQCNFHGLCHGDNEVPEVNCRTCAHSTPELDGDARWSCPKVSNDPNISSIPLATQRTGCISHRYIPILLERIAREVDCVNGDVVYESPSGNRWANGNGADALTSAEVYALEDKRSAAVAAGVKRALAEQGIDGKVIA
jgi:hypothetical protein